VFVLRGLAGYDTYSLLGPKIEASNRGTAIINMVIICGAFSVLVYVGIEIPMVSPPKNPFCAIYHRIKITSFAVAVFCAYFALWFRVFTVFYRNKVMKKNMSKLLQYVNISALPFLCLMVASNLVSFLSAPPYTYAGCGCKAVQSTENNAIKWAILVICTTVFQVVLLFSFTYPLCLHRKKMLSRGCDHGAIIPIVKRAAVVAFVCIISDLLNFAFAALYKGPTVYPNHIAFTCNLLVNLIGTIMSFANWREKLLPFVKTKKSTRATVTEPKQTGTHSQGSGVSNGVFSSKTTSNLHDSETNVI